MADAKTKDGEPATKATRELKPRPVFMVLDGDHAATEQVKAWMADGTLKVKETTRDAVSLIQTVQSGGTVLTGMMK